MKRKKAVGGTRAPSQRQLRVGMEVRAVLSNLLLRGDIHDPDLEKISVTISEVRVSPDLRNATVFILPLGGDQLDDCLAALKRARGYIRHQMAQELTLKAIPDLSFTADSSFDTGSAIDELLNDPRVRQDIQTDETD